MQRLYKTDTMQRFWLYRGGATEYHIAFKNHIADLVTNCIYIYYEFNCVFYEMTGKCFGPRHFSRRDLVTLSIMRGRDHGLPDYNSVRVAYGLNPVSNWSDINSELYGTDPELREVK